MEVIVEIDAVLSIHVRASARLISQRVSGLPLLPRGEIDEFVVDRGGHKERIGDEQ